MNEELKEHINESLKKGIRLDGRKNEEFRHIEIKTGTISTAEGSAHIKFGETELIVGVKLSVGTPFADTPEQGVIMVGTELLPLSNPEFESGPPGVESIEISRVVDRGIRESKMLELDKLFIEKGKIWMVSVDICPINTDGNLIDAGALATIAALKNTRFPEYKDEVIDYKVKTSKGLPLREVPVTVTILKIGDNYVVDPTESEEKVIDSRLTLAFTEAGNICAMQKGGNSPFITEDLKTMIDLAHKKSLELRKKLP